MKKVIILIVLVNVIFLGCANKDGNEEKCPVCDNETQLLVGNKCVDILQVEECGPDGHSHGEDEPCHCFSGQTQKIINGKRYCLQANCEENNDECGGHGKLVNDECHCRIGYEKDENNPKNCVLSVDIDKLACEIEASEIKKAKRQEENPNGQHLELEKKYIVKVLQGKSYVHFPMLEDSEFVVYLSEQSLLTNTQSKDGNGIIPVEFEKENKGANVDCEELFKEVFHIKGVRQHPNDKKEPVVLEFTSASDKDITIFIHLLEDKN